MFVLILNLPLASDATAVSQPHAFPFNLRLGVPDWVQSPGSSVIRSEGSLGPKTGRFSESCARTAARKCLPDLSIDHRLRRGAPDSPPEPAENDRFWQVAVAAVLLDYAP